MNKIGFIGFGRMGQALVQGSLQAQALKFNDVLVFDLDSSARKKAKSLRLKVVSSIAELVRSSQIVFLCVKPQQMVEALYDIKPALSISHAKKCFVSIAAGIPLKKLKQWLGSNTVLYRVMPNTPALLGAGMSVLSRGPNSNSRYEKIISKVLNAVGEVAMTSESFMDTVTAVSGSGPAYVFYLAEAMIRSAEQQGLKPSLARQLVHQTLFGAGLMLKKRKESVEELRRQVTSPGGTTAAAIAEFEKGRFFSLVNQAILKATKRSKELAKG